MVSRQASVDIHTDIQTGWQLKVKTLGLNLFLIITGNPALAVNLCMSV